MCGLCGLWWGESDVGGSGELLCVGWDVWVRVGYGEVGGIWVGNEASLIGHEVRCGQGVSASKAKVEDLLAMSHLETIGDLKAFLGSCVYLSRFIKDYALITTPLYALEASQKTKTNRIRHSGDNANWTALHERAFKT